VTLIAPVRVLATEMAPPRRWRAQHLLAEHGVARHLGARLLAIEPGRIRFADAEGAERDAAADSVVLAEALEPNDALARALLGHRAAVLRAGDCVAPRTFEEAFYEATVAAGSL